RLCSFLLCVSSFCRPQSRSLRTEVVMTDGEVIKMPTEVTSKRGPGDDRDAMRSVEPESGGPTRRRRRIVPFLITLATVVVAGLLGWGMWRVYVGSPWTRDGTVRAYVVTIAPEVAGRIVELPVVDNKYVRKGDLLMVIDPTNYRIAVSQAEAAV